MTTFLTVLAIWFMASMLFAVPFLIGGLRTWLRDRRREQLNPMVLADVRSRVTR